MNANEPELGSFRYKVLTGPIGDDFHHSVAKAISEGYELYGSPAVTFNGKEVIVAQAVFLAAPEKPRMSAVERMKALT
jgi:hypothetical protein